jgi:hypothetical protein
MAEQLALEKRLGDRGAVDCYEWFCRPRAGGMDAARKKLLPRSGLPNEQDGNAPTSGNLSRQRDYFANDETVTNYMRMPPVSGGIRGQR